MLVLLLMHSYRTSPLLLRALTARIVWGICECDGQGKNNTQRYACNMFTQLTAVERRGPSAVNFSFAVTRAALTQFHQRAKTAPSLWLHLFTTLHGHIPIEIQ